MTSPTLLDPDAPALCAFLGVTADEYAQRVDGLVDDLVRVSRAHTDAIDKRGFVTSIRVTAALQALAVAVLEHARDLQTACMMMDNLPARSALAAAVERSKR